ncbi:MAG: hypothetical protein M3Z09_02680 [Acidobacteriota bacterium]|nr:hypothetical protein [Acidobacteriota bacterium]
MLSINKVRQPVTVLAITGSQNDYVYLEKIFSHTNWRLLHSYNLSEAVPAISQCQVILSDAHLPDGNWENVLEHASRELVAPQVIVIAGVADVALWTEVLDRESAFNVVARPFNFKEVTTLISSAWRYGQKQRERMNEAMLAADLETLSKRIGVHSETGLIMKAKSA